MYIRITLIFYNILTPYILIYHSMPFHHHKTSYQCCSQGAPQSRSCLEVCPESVDVPVLHCPPWHHVSEYVMVFSWHPLNYCLLWLLHVRPPVFWLRCNRPLLLPEVGSKPGSVREESRPAEFVPDIDGPWQSLTARQLTPFVTSCSSPRSRPGEVTFSPNSVATLKGFFR